MDPKVFALEHDLKYIETVADDIHIFKTAPGEKETNNLNFQTHPSVVWSEQQHLRQQHKRTTTTINDPYYYSQWHLHTLDVKTQAWDKGITGRNILIAIVDDGLEWTHPDIARNYAAEHSWDFNYNDPDPRPTSEEGHGTSAAGVAAAVCNNFHCGCGVAPEARIAGLRLIARPAYDYVEAKALSYHSDQIHIYSCSWGPPDSGMDMIGPGRVTREVLKQQFNHKGTVYLWAGGNGNANHDNVNYDGYANSIYTIAIGAINNINRQSWYSEPGACLFAVTPSSGNNRGITTVDLMGSAGYASGECTNQFGGTSSATPLAAGIVALLMQNDPAHLKTARDIQHIFAKGATKITDDPTAGWSIPNQRGYTHSHKYGFGILKLDKLLHTTLPIFPLPPQVMISSGYMSVRKIIPCTEKLAIRGSMSFVEQIEVVVSFYANNRGQVGITLAKVGDNDLNKSILAEQRTGDTHRGLTTWTFSTVRHWGSTHRDGNEWIVSMVSAPAIGAQLRGVEVRIYGY